MCGARALGLAKAKRPWQLGRLMIRLKRRCKRQSKANWLFWFFGVGGWSGLALNSVGWLYQCANQ